MPSSPKSSTYYARQAATSRRSTVIVAVIIITIIGIVALLRGGSRCLSPRPRSVRVVWEHGRSNENLGVGTNRHKVMGFVGIQTGFGSLGRRKALRKTWFPSDQEGLQRLEEATGLAFRFIIGKTRDRAKMSALQKEIAEYDDFLQLDIEEEYSKLPYKTLAFFKAAYALFDAEYYVKADDDIYLRPDRLSILLAKERSHTQSYIGCMKKGSVITDPELKWYEPLSYLLGKEYFLHAYGPIYVLSADVVSSLVALRNDSFRMFSNEDVTIGAWMLAMNVEHEDNHELCASDCSGTSIAVWDIPKCSGLCNPENKMLALHKKDTCSKTPTLESDDNDNDDDN
ncbi:hypothetical protein Lal_00019137 [Lupinus albus]|uniref:Hexosyltransferase n=1 Tax=Lupinus albus TaxID=3870 RepID=A0A6A4R466_LUPAL|nr:putative galactosylxylosylprotein 3-beta-galactosyltransferase [Lupinus albus]KAF1899016.1 hypothetical protein Lal_00019137 [Lupinus albus]